MARGDPKSNRTVAEGSDLGTPKSFLSRWSQRKAWDRAGKTNSIPAPNDDPHPSEPPESPMEAALPTDAHMPPIEALNETSDYRDFLSPQVSEELKRIALRKLFHQSKFNYRDGLDDYDEDYRLFTPLGEVITADMRHQLERQAAKAQELLTDSEADTPEATLPPVKDNTPYEMGSTAEGKNQEDEANDKPST